MSIGPPSLASLLSSVAAAFLFLWIGGALGSRGFLGRRCFTGASVPDPLAVPSAPFVFTIDPGFRPGFLRGTPAAVSRTPSGVAGCDWGCMTLNRGATDGSTMISSISIFALPALRNRVGDPGSEMADGGDESDVGDELGFCISTSLPPDAAMLSGDRNLYLRFLSSHPRFFLPMQWRVRCL